MSKQISTLYIILVICALALLFTMFLQEKNSEKTDVFACAADAKVCPDGTSVGRLAPNCEFAPCSNTSDSSNASNSVDLSVNLIAASDYSKMNGDFAIVAVQNGDVILEEYRDGYDENDASHLHSATKAFWAAMAARMVQDGLFSYDDYVAEYITEWQANPKKSKIKIVDVLELSSGHNMALPYIQGIEPGTYDVYDYVVNNLKMVRNPGEQFQYGPADYYTFAVLSERILNNIGYDNPLEYLEEKIFTPIGLEYKKWSYDRAGNPLIPAGAYVTPKNWIKYGQLLLQKGQWEGIEVIGSTYVDELFVPAAINPGHGKFVWLNTKGGFNPFDQSDAPIGSLGGHMYHKGMENIVGALGAGKNRMYIIPDKNLVILRATMLEQDKFDDSEFLSRLLD